MTSADSPTRDDDAWEIVDLDRLERYLWSAAGACWTVFLVSVVGELRGWWEVLGEVGSTVGGVLGGVLTLVALLVHATKDQVRGVRVGVTDNGRRLGMIHDGVRRLHQDFEELQGESRRQTEVLENIRDRL